MVLLSTKFFQDALTVFLKLDSYRETRRRRTVVYFTYLTLSSSEEAMEEGEIVHDSSGKAIAESCRALMVEILTRMHSSACLPHLVPGQAPPKTTPQGQQAPVGGAGDGCGLELTIGLQCGLEQWCRQLLELVKDTSTNALG